MAYAILSEEFLKVCGYANFLIVATWNDEDSLLLVGRKSLLFRVDQLAVEGTPYIGPIYLPRHTLVPRAMKDNFDSVVVLEPRCLRYLS